MGVFVAAVIATILYPVFGSLADRWGRKTTYLLGAVLMLVSIIPGVRPDQHRQRVRVRHSPSCSSSASPWPRPAA